MQVVLLPRSNTTTLVTGGLADDVLDDEAAIVASFLHYSTLSTVVYKKVFLFLFCSSVGGSHSLLMCVGLFSSERGERGRKQLRRYRWPFLFLSSVETPTLVQANRFFSLLILFFIMAWFYGHVITAFQLALELVY